MRSRVACGALLSKTSVSTEQKTKALALFADCLPVRRRPRTLIRVDGDQFREMMSGARHSRFSSHD
jgi:hypothetical protein